MKTNDKILDIQRSRGIENGSNVTCMAYALHEDKLIFGAFIGADVGMQAARALCYTEGKLNLTYPRIKVKVGSGFDWRMAPVDSINKTVGYFMSHSMLGLMHDENYTYVMDLDATSRSPYNNEQTVQLIGQRIKEISNAPILPQWYLEIVKWAFTVDSEKNWRDGLVRSISAENCQVWAVKNDGERWAGIVSTLLANNKIKITRNQ